MSSLHRSSAKPDSAPVLRFIYALVFFGIAASALTAASPELLQLFHALSREYHFGAPPNPLVLLGASVIAVGVMGIVVAFLRRRQIPLGISACVLGGTVLCVAGLRSGTAADAPEGRSWAAADRTILATATRVQRQMVDVLQREGGVSRAHDAWERVLREQSPGPSPARDRSFGQLPYRLVMLEEEGSSLAHLPPATLAVWVATDGVSFQIHPVGFTPEGRVGPLTDDRSDPLVLTGTYNPEMQEPPTPAVPSGVPGSAPIWPR